VREAQIKTLYVKGRDGATKPLPALDLAFNCAENRRGYYHVTLRHHLSAQFKSKAMEAFLPPPPLIIYLP
jgi:hypothetical protein